MAAIAYTSEVKNNYQQMFDGMQIHADKLADIDAAAALISRNQSTYTAISNATPNKVPWFLIGLIHYRESNCNFNTHLHNGDPLTARTVNVPAGRPTTGNPPFTFMQSALDALQYQGWFTWNDWSLPGVLFKLEEYNGFGYRLYHGINSPYLWSFSNWYTKGLYVADNSYNANAVSNQAGVAVILKRIAYKNNLFGAGVSVLTFIAVAVGIYLLIKK